MSDVGQTEAPDRRPNESQAQVDAWHYDRGGKRIGPVGRGKIAKLIAANRIDRATLVWHPAMTEWARAGHSELSGLFGDKPPPLPATEIRRGALYLLALFPIWGTAVQAVASAVYASRLGLTPRDMFDQWAWLIPFFVFNSVLASWDEHNLRKGGLRLRGAVVLGAVLVPFYILASCRTIQRHSGRSAWVAYLPLLLWILGLAAIIVLDPLVFNPDAPLAFNPDQWF